MPSLLITWHIFHLALRRTRLHMNRIILITGAEDVALPGWTCRQNWEMDVRRLTISD